MRNYSKFKQENGMFAFHKYNCSAVSRMNWRRQEDWLRECILEKPWGKAMLA